MASTEVEHGPIDTGWAREPVDAPSARFGWHARPKKFFLFMGWFCVFWLLFLLVGNHVGRVEDIYLVVLAVLLAGLLIKGTFFNRDSKWKR